MSIFKRSNPKFHHQDEKLARRVLKSLAYRKGYQVEIKEHMPGLLSLACQMHAKDGDVRGPITGADMITLTFDFAFEYDPPLTDVECQFAIYKAIEGIESHERHEWLKFDGKHFIDPHP